MIAVLWLLAAGVFALHTATILFWVLEIKLTFLFTGGGDVGFLTCYLLVMLGSLCFLIPAVPASLGFYELTYLSLFALLGIDLEQGLAVILVRRVLSLVSAGIGLLPMLRMRRRALGSDRAATPSERNERS